MKRTAFFLAVVLALSACSSTTRLPPEATNSPECPQPQSPQPEPVDGGLGGTGISGGDCPPTSQN